MISAGCNIEQPAFTFRMQESAARKNMMQCYAANGRKRAPSIRIAEREKQMDREILGGETQTHSDTGILCTSPLELLNGNDNVILAA